MSQSSETTKAGEDFLALKYPEQRFSNDYYTAKVAETYGVCISRMVGCTFIQFFPWVSPLLSSSDHGHGRYAAFICRQAGRLEDIDKKYDSLPYYKLPVDIDLLTIKCLVEEGIIQCHSMTP